MNKKKQHIGLYIFVIILFSSIFFDSCANVSAGPSGGVKDTIPPVITAIFPPLDNTMHPRGVKASSISIEFDEYIKLNNPMNNIFVSPPQEKPIETKIKGKRLIVSFQEPLDSATTYSIDYGRAIQDNNEGNQYPGLIYSFSTGPEIDSLYVSGTIQDSKTLSPIENATILFHTDHSDSAVYKIKPAGAAKSDTWGYFRAVNLKAGSYRVYAISDQNNNQIYDPDSEEIAFMDSLFIPEKVMSPDSLELQIFDMKDTINCLSRPSELRLSLFKEISTRQFLKSSGRHAERMVYLTFGAPDAQIKSFRFLDVSKDAEILSEYNTMKDSLAIWINYQKKIKDTIRMRVEYKKLDDSLGVLVDEIDTIRLSMPKKKYKENERGEMIEEKDTVAKYKLNAVAENINQDGLELEFDFPLLTTAFDSIKVTSISAKQQSSDIKFSVTQDSTCIRKYLIRLDKELEPGYEYIFKFPHRQFFDINGLPCDSLEKKFTLPNDESLSSITINAQDVESNYIVELTDSKRSKVLRKYFISDTTSLLFPYLKADKYSIRITNDKNGNGLIDTGNLLEKIQPEKVILYKFGEGNSDDAYILDLPEKMELEQTLNFKELFK